MASTAEELEVKTSTEAAQSFIDWFYASVSDRKLLSSFYINSNAKYAQAGAVAADIVINGVQCPTVADFEKLLEKQALGTAAPESAAAAPGAPAGTATNGASSSAVSNAIAHRVRYSVDGFDVHVLNPTFRLACPNELVQRLAPTGPANSGARNNNRDLQQKMASLLVQVTGNVQYGGGKDAPRGAFTETFVLVPNWDALLGGARAPRGLRSTYLIQSQNFRAL